MEENKKSSLQEFYDGVQSGKYIPYIDTGDKWVPLDSDEALVLLSERNDMLQTIYNDLRRDDPIAAREIVESIVQRLRKRADKLLGLSFALLIISGVLRVVCALT